MKPATFYTCAVCGAEVYVHVDLKHRCPPRTLAGIDGADTAAWNRELDPDTKPEPDHRDLWTRLRDGHRLNGHRLNDMRGDGDRDPYR